MAQANFADAAGFSGRGGFTCVACHTQPSPQPAQVSLSGLPADGWSPGVTYSIRVEVTGGPPALPGPAPQGGFDLAASAGIFVVDDALLRLPSPNEVTYRPAGTMMRAWGLEWTAPDLSAQPAPVKFWLAAIAANGNHVVALNASDGGETLDAAASMTTDVAPSEDALSEWRALPLTAPTAVVTGDAMTGWLVEGQHTDANATGLAWRTDGAWTPRATGGSWRIALPQGLTAPVVEVRSEGAGRTSAAIPLSIGDHADVSSSSATMGNVEPTSHATTAPGSAWILVPLLATLLAATRSRTP